MPLYLGCYISAPLPCPASPYLSQPLLQDVRVSLMRRGAGSAAQPFLGLRSAGCWRVERLLQVTFRLDTRLRAQTRRPSPFVVLTWLSEALALNTRGAGRLCIPCARAHCP